MMRAIVVHRVSSAAFSSRELPHTETTFVLAGEALSRG
jgi:hypothetical protein